MLAGVGAWGDGWVHLNIVQGATASIPAGLLGTQQLLSGADLCVCLSAAGCTFEEDDDLNQCEYSQGEDDDFGWELVRSYMMPHLTADLPHGESQPQTHSWSHAWDGDWPWVDLIHPPSRGRWDAAVPHGKV